MTPLGPAALSQDDHPDTVSENIHGIPVRNFQTTSFESDPIIANGGPLPAVEDHLMVTLPSVPMAYGAPVLHRPAGHTCEEPRKPWWVLTAAAPSALGLMPMRRRVMADSTRAEHRFLEGNAGRLAIERALSCTSCLGNTSSAGLQNASR